MINKIGVYIDIGGPIKFSLCSVCARSFKIKKKFSLVLGPRAVHAYH